MKVWANTQFEGHWPVGTAAVVAADTADEAASTLSAALAGIGLAQQVTAQQMIEFVVVPGAVCVLRDGDY